MKQFTDLYKAIFGEKGMKRFCEVTEKVKRGRMTYRQAASTLGITYYEFARALLDEKSAIDQQSS